MIKSIGSDHGILKCVGGEIALLRRECGLSQEDMAEFCAMHPNSIGRIERGETDSSIVLLSYLYFNLGSSGVEIDPRGVIPLRGKEQMPKIFLRLRDMNAANMVRKMGVTFHERRKSMGLSLDCAAGAALIHRNTLWNFEHGLVCSSILSYFRLLRVLEVKQVTQDAGHPILH